MATSFREIRDIHDQLMMAAYVLFVPCDKNRDAYAHPQSTLHLIQMQGGTVN